MMKGLINIPHDTSFNFMKMRFFAFFVSAALFFGSVGLVMTQGINFGVDFTGGTIVEIKTPVSPDLAALRKGLGELGIGAVSIQEFGEPDDLLIRLPDQPAPEGWQEGDEAPNQAAVNKVMTYLDTTLEEGGKVDYRRTEFVGPQVGKELKLKGMYAVLFSLIGIAGYIWLRFEWQFAVTGLIAVFHDAVTIIGFFALSQIEFSLSSVAAVLLVCGYSINDTVVVFDRVRENLRKYKKTPLLDLFNLTVNQTLSRTIMTSFTTLLALAALWYFGGEVIRSFVYALILGIVIGTYSSIYVACPILLYLGMRRNAATQEAQPEGE